MTRKIVNELREVIVAALEGGPRDSRDMAAACGKTTHDRNYTLARKSLLEDKTLSYVGAGSPRRYSLAAAEVAEPTPKPQTTKQRLESMNLAALAAGPLESKALAAACNADPKSYIVSARQALLAAGKIADLGEGRSTGGRREHIYGLPPAVAA